jgi:dihydrolipoamide dehydrogenase
LKQSKKVSKEQPEIAEHEAVTLPDKPEVLAPSAPARPMASPHAKTVARSLGIDISTIRGTGPDGMIVAEDVRKAAALKEMPQEVPKPIKTPVVELEEGQRIVPAGGMRRAIAKKMMASKVETAQTYMSVSADAGRVMALREAVLSEIQAEYGVRITITDIMMKIAGEAVRRHPVINTRWTEQGVIYNDKVNMGMAMALDDGLIVPVIRDINQKGLADVGRARVELIKKGKTGRFLPDDITGSTVTLSAMGMFGIEQFTANINVPENAILAVGAITDKPVAVAGKVVIRPMVNVTLSYDHRTIDGAEAGKFMQTLKSLIEDPGFLRKTRITIVGGGVAGYPAAIIAARLGAEITLIERDHLGGVCLNWGCIPTKSLLQSCEVLKTIEEASVFGIACEGAKADLSRIMSRKESVVAQLRSGVEKLLSAKKIKVVRGTGKLLDSRTVQVLETGEKIISDRIIIASGSRPVKLSLKGVEGSDVWDSNSFLSMAELPKRAVVIGGGVVGVEFAQILRRLGSEVSIVEMTQQLVPGMDGEISLALRKSLESEGIKVFVQATVTSLEHGTCGLSVTMTLEGKTQALEAEKVIMSVGRRPDLSLLNVERIGLGHKNGALLVDERMETTVPGVYAAGDVVGGIMLAHVATSEGECAAKNAMGIDTRIDYKAIPSCIYTSPEVAWVGLTEEAAQKGREIVIGRFPFYGCGKALVINSTYGMVKIIAEKSNGKVLGVHIIGPHATDMISEAVLGMAMDVTAEKLAHAVHPHPSLSETVMEAALTLCGGAIHMP